MYTLWQKLRIEKLNKHNFAIKQGFCRRWHFLSYNLFYFFGKQAQNKPYKKISSCLTSMSVWERTNLTALATVINSWLVTCKCHNLNLKRCFWMNQFLVADLRTSCPFGNYISFHFNSNGGMTTKILYKRYFCSLVLKDWTPVKIGSELCEKERDEKICRLRIDLCRDSG